MKQLGIFIGLCLAAFSQAQDLFGTEKQAYMLMPADVISGGMVQNVQISDSNRYVTYKKLNVPSADDIVTGQFKEDATWYLYDRTTKTSSRLPIPSNTRELFVIGDGSAIFFMTADESQQGFVDLRTGAINSTKIKVENLTYLGEYSYAPYLIAQEDGKEALLLRPNGQSLSIKLPPKVRLMSPIASDNGSIAFLAVRRVTPLEFGKAIYRFADGDLSYKAGTREEWQNLHPAFGKSEPITAELGNDLFYIKPSNLPKDVKTDFPTRAKLGMSNCSPRVSGDGSFVVFQDAGALLIRDIKPVDGTNALKLLADAQKLKAINDAKQSALALLMYAADMDDALPGAEGWEDKVNPYALNKDMLKGFNYTFRGGSLTGVESPATTELGFTLGPGGRAVAYLDGHVKWIPNP